MKLHTLHRSAGTDWFAQESGHWLMHLSHKQSNSAAASFAECGHNWFFGAPSATPLLGLPLLALPPPVMVRILPSPIPALGVRSSTLLQQATHATAATH